MRFRSKYSHVIDAVFPIAVFFVFAASALAVLMLSAKIYNSTTTSSADNYTSRTAFAYVSEKIRQSDVNGNISCETREGIDYLVLQNDTYTTYIYAYDGELKELRLKDGVDASPDAGSDIAALKAFTVQEIADRVFRFDFTFDDGSTCSTVASGRSVR